MTNTQSWSSHEGTSPHYQGQVFDEATGATIAITYSDEDGAHVKLIAQALRMAEVLQDIQEKFADVLEGTGAAGMIRDVLRDAGVL